MSQRKTSTSILLFGPGKVLMGDVSIDQQRFLIFRDDLSHAPEEVFTREETLDTVRTVTRELASVGLPVMPSLGNHDIIPKNQVKSLSLSSPI